MPESGRLPGPELVPDCCRHHKVSCNAIAYESFFCKSLDGSILGDATGAGDTDDFAFQLVELDDAFCANQGVVHIGLDTADDRQRRTLDDGADRWNTGDEGVIHVAANKRGGGGRPAPIKTVLTSRPSAAKNPKSCPTMSGRTPFRVGV